MRHQLRSRRIAPLGSRYSAAIHRNAHAAFGNISYARPRRDSRNTFRRTSTAPLPPFITAHVHFGVINDRQLNAAGPHRDRNQ